MPLKSPAQHSALEELTPDSLADCCRGDLVASVVKVTIEVIVEWDGVRLVGRIEDGLEIEEGNAVLIGKFFK